MTTASGGETARRPPLRDFWRDLPREGRLPAVVAFQFSGTGLVLPLWVVYLHEIRGFGLETVGLVAGFLVGHGLGSTWIELLLAGLVLVVAVSVRRVEPRLTAAANGVAHGVAHGVGQEVGGVPLPPEPPGLPVATDPAPAPR